DLHDGVLLSPTAAVDVAGVWICGADAGVQSSVRGQARVVDHEQPVGGDVGDRVFAGAGAGAGIPGVRVATVYSERSTYSCGVEGSGCECGDGLIGAQSPKRVVH